MSVRKYLKVGVEEDEKHLRMELKQGKPLAVKSSIGQFFCNILKMFPSIKESSPISNWMEQIGYDEVIGLGRKMDIASSVCTLDLQVRNKSGLVVLRLKVRERLKDFGEDINAGGFQIGMRCTGAQSNPCSESDEEGFLGRRVKQERQMGLSSSGRCRTGSPH